MLERDDQDSGENGKDNFFRIAGLSRIHGKLILLATEPFPSVEQENIIYFIFCFPYSVFII